MFIEHVRNVTARVCIGSYVELGDDWSSKGVLLEDSKLFYITEGELVIKTSMGETVCREGEMVLIPAGLRHDYYIHEGGYAKKFWVHFGMEIDGESIFDKYNLPLNIRVDENDRAKITACFDSILTDHSYIGSEYGRLGALFSLIEYYLRFASAKKKKTGGDEIERVLGYISENLDSPLTLSTLASVACLSPNYLVRKFRARMGVSPLKYVTMIRIDRAKWLLGSTDDRISDVMTKIGYTDAAYFSKCFRAYTGYSPRAFKKIFGVSKKQ